MRHHYILAAALLAAAGCGERQEAGRNMSANEVAAELRNVQIQPGLWEATSRVVDVSAPNLPVQLRDQMIARPATSRRNCITPEQAARPDANFFMSQAQANCSYRDFSMRNGRLQGTMSCTGGGMPGTMTTTMAGAYGPASYDMTMRMQTTGMPQGADMTIEARTTGRRVGDCPAGGEEGDAKQ